MSAVLPELFMLDQFVNSSCGGRMNCDSLFELGPPPDSILNIPPPPVPPFMEDFVNRLASEGLDLRSEDISDTSDCNLCHWAAGNGVGFVELAQKGPLIDDTWFLVIISSCVGATLLGIILAIAFLKYREGKLKPLSDNALAKKEKALGLERCEAVLYPATAMSPTDPRASRALWAGLKPLEGNHYTVDHCQPMDQKTPRIDLLTNADNTYDYADFSSITYTPQVFGHPNNMVNLSTMTMGPQYNHHPMQAPSFENIAYVPGSEDPNTGSITIQKIGPDGCVVTRAAYVLGNNTIKQSKPVSHLYEMVTPSKSHSSNHSSRRHKSLERGALRQTPVISAPTNAPTMRLPPLNSRYNGHYTLTALANGSHTLYPQQNTEDRRFAHVSLDKSGFTNTTLAPSSPSDNIYASPITSPVI